MKVSFGHVLLGGLLLYFTYHALAGEQGLANWTDLQKKQESLTLRRDVLLLEKKETEVRLGRLRAESLDLDYVEEIARRKMSLTHTEDIIVSIK
ncbi:MAG: septum formation initiator family protein [Pseudomonadota bacterium]